MKTKPQRPKIYGMQKCSCKREVYTNTSSMRKQEKFQRNNLNLYLKNYKKDEIQS